MDRVEALAEAWASIDGRLNHFNAKGDTHGSRAGYMCEAEEMIRRLEKRGFTVVKMEHAP